MTKKILYLCTADARGHLMRSQLLTHALRAAGTQVDVMTTSEYGQRFLAEFDIGAELLSEHYAVQFDRAQNMLRTKTDRNVAHYIFRPSRMLRDIVQLRRRMLTVDLVVNDSFHPALLMMGLFPRWRRKIVHVYGASLRVALERNFYQRLPGWIAGIFRRLIHWQIESAHARIEHDFAYHQVREYAHNSFQLPTPVVVASVVSEKPNPELCTTAAVYLNPHFQDTALAEALEAGIDDTQSCACFVGEGYTRRSGWKAQDIHWVEKAIQSDLIISAPGMATLSIALIYDKPILLVLTDQPEQAANVQRAAEFSLRYEVVIWRSDKVDFRRQIALAITRLLNKPGRQDAIAGEVVAAARIECWVKLLVEL